MSFVQLGSAGVQIITLLTLPCDGRLACVSTINKAKQHETQGLRGTCVCMQRHKNTHIHAFLLTSAFHIQVLNCCMALRK